MFLQYKDVNVAKEEFRKIGLSIRRKAYEKDQLVSRQVISVAELGLKENLTNLFDFMGINNSSIVSSYISIRSEINTNAVMNWLRSNGYIVCLPVIEKGNSPLDFYEWTKNARLKSGQYGIPIPIEKTKCEPDILLCPLVSFDFNGNRLGYGGGFYDRTIKKLRKTKKVLVIGLGFSEQGSKIKLPFDKNDQKLDAMVTDKQFFIFNEK